MAKNINPILASLLVGGISAGLELFIGHNLILNPLLLGHDYGFVRETFFQPTYYGLSKAVIIAITFYLVYFTNIFIKVIQSIAYFKDNKSTLVALLSTALFGIYYYTYAPHITIQSSIYIGIVHIVFINFIAYIGERWLL